MVAKTSQSTAWWHQVRYCFQNPFRGETLRKVINNIHGSLLRSPRKLQIIYYNRLFFDAEASQLNWIKKIRHEPCFPRASWALYEAKLPHSEAKKTSVRRSRVQIESYRRLSSLTTLWPVAGLGHGCASLVIQKS